MGIDTRYWGPSAWQLFHLIAFRSQKPQKLLSMIKEILPCKFCRQSTTQFVLELPLKGDPGKWLYTLHNKVNHKLRTQAETDPLVVDPGPDPTFEDVKERYMSVKPTSVPGRDFLFSIAVNYDGESGPIQSSFLETLAPVYPFKSDVFQKYMKDHPPALETNKSYMKWMYGLLKELSNAMNVEIPTYRGYVQRAMYYKSGCSKKTYKGKTCRNKGGFRTKDRDTKRTFRITHQNLLH